MESKVASRGDGCRDVPEILNFDDDLAVAVLSGLALLVG